MGEREDAGAVKAPPGRDGRGRFLATQTRQSAAGAAKARGPQQRATKARARKPVRWSAKREAAFLAALAETGNVAASARAAKLSETTVYRRRQKSEDFRALWMAALREGVVKLETRLLDRALNGVEKAVWHGGKQVGTVVEFNDRIALALIAAHRGSVHGSGLPGPAAAAPTLAERRKALEDELAQMNLRMGGAG